MTRKLQILRGTTAQNNAYTGAVGELTMDTDTNSIRVHDGSTVGGIQIPSAQTADYVVEWQTPTDLNNYTWYRKYKSGWVEQGGRLTQSGSATLPIEMQNNNYNLQVRLDYNESTPIYGIFWYATKTTTGFTMGAFETYIPVDWQVSGMAAQ